MQGVSACLLEGMRKRDSVRCPTCPLLSKQADAQYRASQPVERFAAITGQEGSNTTGSGRAGAKPQGPLHPKISRRGEPALIQGVTDATDHPDRRSAQSRAARTAHYLQAANRSTARHRLAPTNMQRGRSVLALTSPPRNPARRSKPEGCVQRRTGSGQMWRRCHRASTGQPVAHPNEHHHR